MEQQSKFVSATQIFLASTFLFIGLLKLESALSYDGLEEKFIADNWGDPLIILLIIMFDFGWWYENYVQYLTVSRGRVAFLLAMIGLLFVFALIAFGSLIFIPQNFLQYAIHSSLYILLSGFFYRFSIMQPQIKANIRPRS